MENQNLEDLLNEGEENKKEARRQRQRERYANMTEEEKETLKQYQSERRVSMTEEKKKFTISISVSVVLI